MAQKRSRIEVIHSMLDAIHKKGGTIKPTHLMYKANLSHGSLQKHVEHLQKSELVTTVTTAKGKVYTLTDKGYKFLQEYQRLRVLADTFGL